jgi:hypothetical protein
MVAFARQNDAFNRRIESIYDSNGAASGGVSSLFYVYDQTNVIIDLSDADGPDSLGGTTYSPAVQNRYLRNPQAADQLLAQESKPGAAYDSETWWVFATPHPRN